MNFSQINSTSEVNTSQTPAVAGGGYGFVDEPHFSKIIRYVIYCVLFVFAICGNVTVCIIPFRHKRMRTCTYFLITNLAVSDIGTMLCLPYILVMEWENGEWTMGSVMCKLVNPSLTMFYLVTTNTLVAIAVHRFVVVVFPFHSKLSKSKVALVILLTWLTAFFCVLPSFGARELQPIGAKANGEIAYMCTEVFPGRTKEEQLYYEKIYTIFQYVVNISLPIVIIVILYIAIAYKLRRMALALGRVSISQSCRRDSEGTVTLQSTLTKSRSKFSRKSSIDQFSARKRNELERKFLKMLAVVVAIFVVCYVPYTTFFLVVPHQPAALQWKYLKIFYHYIYLLMWFPNALNPLCYGALDEHYASTIKALCHLKRKSRRFGSHAGNSIPGNSYRARSLLRNNNTNTMPRIVEQSHSPAASSNSTSEEGKKSAKKRWKVFSWS